jgi:catechol 2,3-dioxygenase-like lactoylglutathione lyase family enzyme
MIKHIAFTLYPVSEMARARRFYEETLGLPLARCEVWDFEWVLDDGTFAFTDRVDGGSFQRRRMRQHRLRGAERRRDGPWTSHERRAYESRAAVHTCLSPRRHSRL